MPKRTHIDDDSNLLSIEQTASKANLGMNVTRNIADEADAVLKIGKSVRIQWDKFYDYLIHEYKQK